jgi:Tfp pilus assembly protein PilF
MNLKPMRRRWAALIGGLSALLFAGCAHVQPPPGGDARVLLHDEWFAPSQEDTSPARVLALSDAMRSYADNDLRALIAHRDPRRVLIEALHDRGQLRLAYDAERTGNAAETFESRAGNCLSLVLMTGALARHLGLPVTFRAVQLDPQYTRAGGLTLENGHVNILMAQMGERPIWGAYDLVVDFLPTRELTGHSAVPLPEHTVVAMYMNNRAAETLADGRVDDSYAWARAALLQDPGHASAVNTLAVIYMRRGQYPAAEETLRYALAREAENTAALSNLVLVLRHTGRQTEADVTAAKLKALQPYPPFYFLEAGRRALAAGQAAEARDLFERELRRQPFQHEVHFWSAQAWMQLGNSAKAAEHLRQAMDYSTTMSSQKLYSAKLERLRALRLQ